MGIKTISVLLLVLFPIFYCEKMDSSDLETTNLIPDSDHSTTKINLVLLKNLNVSENVIISNEQEFDPDTWIAPYEIRKDYPYFLSGFDEENRPIWIAQWGSFDLRKAVLQGNEAVVEKYVQQAAYIIIKSHGIRSTPDNPVHSASFIVDFDGLKLDQVAHVPTVALGLKLARMTRPLLEKYTDKIIIVNANYITELVINLMKPVLGGLFGRMQVFGTNRNLWLPHVQRTFPKKELPQYYGGFKNPKYKPLLIQG